MGLLRAQSGPRNPLCSTSAVVQKSGQDLVLHLSQVPIRNTSQLPEPTTIQLSTLSSDVMSPPTILKPTPLLPQGIECPSLARMLPQMSSPQAVIPYFLFSVTDLFLHHFVSLLSTENKILPQHLWVQEKVQYLVFVE